MGLVVPDRFHTVQHTTSRLRIYRREIYWVNLPEGKGSEQTGERPVVIVSNDAGNRFSSIVNVVPLSLQVEKSKKLSLPTQVVFWTPTGFQVALCEQSRPIDKSRLKTKVNYRIPEDVMEEIEYAIAVVYGIQPSRKKADF